MKVTYDASAEPKAWTYSPLKYWPTVGHVDFLAYAPRVENKQLKGSSIDFTVESDAANQKDLLWANAIGQTKENGKVTFKFAHALSRLGYTVKLNDDYTGTTIKLNKITLAGSKDGTKQAFYKKGTIDLSYTSSTTSPTTSLWTQSEEKQDFEWYSGNDQLSKTTAVENPTTEYLFVIPQKFSKTTPGADELYVIVEYTITYSDQTIVNTKVYKQLDKNFEQGRAYTINLSLGLTPIEFEVTTVDTWLPGEDVNIPLN